jgi:hypothetical protein
VKLCDFGLSVYRYSDSMRDHEKAPGTVCLKNASLDKSVTVLLIPSRFGWRQKSCKERILLYVLLSLTVLFICFYT